MESAGFDLNAYLERIGYTGERTPTLTTLREIQRRHPEAIPFENLNPLIGWPVLLDSRSLQQKLVHGGRGGYCFEHNLLLMHALRAIGFQVTGLAALVLPSTPGGPLPARTHMLVRVDIKDESYLCDAGFGRMTLTGPVRLAADVEQVTPHELRRLSREGDEFVMQAKVKGEWRSLYRFSLQEQLLPDYEMANYYVSTNPKSHFTTTLTAARPAPHRRYTLRNNEFTEHDEGGDTERRVLTSAAELRETLETVFRIQLADAPELDEALERITSDSSPE